MANKALGSKRSRALVTLTRKKAVRYSIGGQPQKAPTFLRHDLAQGLKALRRAPAREGQVRHVVLSTTIPVSRSGGKMKEVGGYINYDEGRLVAHVGLPASRMFKATAQKASSLSTVRHEFGHARDLASGGQSGIVGRTYSGALHKEVGRVSTARRRIAGTRMTSGYADEFEAWRQGVKHAPSHRVRKANVVEHLTQLITAQQKEEGAPSLPGTYTPESLAAKHAATLQRYGRMLRSKDKQGVYDPATAARVRGKLSAKQLAQKRAAAKSGGAKRRKKGK